MFKQKIYAETVLKTQTVRLHLEWVERFWLVQKRDGQNLRPALEEIPLTLLASLGAYDLAYEVIGIKPKQILHSKEQVVLVHPPQIGDEIEAITFIKDLYEQQSSNGPLGFIVMGVMGKKEGKVIFACERTVAIRGGFKRG